MTAVPAKIPKASPLVVENPRNVPNAGKIRAASTLKKKMTIEDELQVGQTVRVKVLDIRREGGKEKISLSIKQA